MGWSLLPRPAGTKLYLDADFLRLTRTVTRSTGDRDNVGNDYSDYEEVLSVIENSLLLAGTLLTVGQLCHITQRSDRTLELTLVTAILKNIARLAVERFANCFKCREPNRFRFPVFENREIGHRNTNLFSQFGNAHFTLSEHHVDVDDNCHMYFRRLSHFPI